MECAQHKNKSPQYVSGGFLQDYEGKHSVPASGKERGRGGVAQMRGGCRLGGELNCIESNLFTVTAVQR